jgi:N-acetylglucosaminyl-diphospho-decaprenol L-rhamnosyltransferase
MTSLSIVIVTYNAKAYVAGCLRSLLDTPPAIPHDITIVDNASTDGVMQMVKADWPAVNIVDMGRNAGFAAANNAGIRASTGTYVLLLNSDTIVRAGAIDTLVATLESTPDVAIAGPRIVDGGGEPELSFGRMISPVAEVRQKVLGRRADWIARETRREQFVDWVSGACLLVRRADAEAVGLLDDRFFLYTEDVDFCAAVRARGHRVLFTPRAEIVHLRGQSRATAPQAASAAYRRSHLAFYEKHHPAWAPWLRLYLRIKGELPTEATEEHRRTQKNAD